MTVMVFETPSITRRQRSAPRRRTGGVGRSVLTRLRQWRRRAKERAELAALDDRMLADLGISRAEAQFLSNKPVGRE
jgi:uncharacterized protein YjiS (DUF1127 family)